MYVHIHVQRPPILCSFSLLKYFQVRHEIGELMEDNKSSSMLAHADMDARIVALSKQLVESEDKLESKIQSVSTLCVWCNSMYTIKFHCI